MPIILLTVNNMEVDIVTGLEAGANDYITKPFSLMVLRARVSVQLRNKEAAAKILWSLMDLSSISIKWNFQRWRTY